jgi:Tfp pilus assembly protein PilF
MSNLVRKILTLIICSGLAWLSVAFCLGGIVPYDFVESKTPPSALTDKWRVLGAEQLTVVAERALLGNSLSKAEKAASQALWQDPTHGGAATQLAITYARQGKLMEADRMADRAKLLWPSRCSTNLTLARYWKERGQPEKGLKNLPAGCKQ